MFQTATKSIPVLADATRVARTLDGLAVAVLVLAGAIAALTFRDYGLGWDDYTHSQYGDLLLKYYGSGFADRRALSFVNLYMYGGGFDLASALAAKVLPLSLFETRRLMGAIVGLVGLFFTWRLGRRLGGPLAGLSALLLLATCPLYYGHMFMNAKDGPFAAAMALALLGIVRAFEEYPRASVPTLALCAIGMGLAVGSRVLGGFAILSTVCALALVLAIRWRGCGRSAALREWGSFLAPFIPAVVFAYIVMGLIWPWAVVSPLNPFRALHYFFAGFFDTPWPELFDGKVMSIIDMPRSYVPTLMALKLPELMLVLGLCGTAGALVEIVRGEACHADATAGRRAGLLAVMLTVALPIAATVAARPAMYNGIRHFVFLTPPFAALGGLAASWIMRWLRHRGRAGTAAGSVVLLAGFASPAIDMARLHPYEYTHFNHIAGGVKGAQSRYMIDYWGLSMTQASWQLRTLLAKTGAKPDGNKWIVAVCGPHPAVVVALGPGYSAVWDPKGADFAMMLNEFYCAKLDAPVVSQVVRDGVVYARVYDIRGRTIPTLHTPLAAKQ